jgi:ribose transport system ATP-binding protein
MAVIAQNISMTFGTFRALSDVNLKVKHGEIHALLGANGSGKSTLSKILSGVYQPSAGTISVGGRILQGISSPHQANELGIAVVHQEAPLVDSMSVAECIALFRGYPMQAGRIAWKDLYRDTAGMLMHYGVNIDPQTVAGRLSPAERALVALAIALDRVKTGLELLILDEVTAALPESQAQIFLERVASIAQSGVAVLMVTHRLAELHGRANRVTVLRNGEVVHAAPAGEADDEELVRLMTGASSDVSAETQSLGSEAIRQLWNLAGSKPPAKGGNKSDKSLLPALVVDRVSGAFLQDISFYVRPGEIVGVAGLIESGIGELPELLSGAKTRTSGEIRVGGKALSTSATPSDTISAGIAVLPADRLRAGGVGTLSISDNTVLPDLSRWWHRRGREGQLLKHVINMLDIRPPRPEAVFGTLSGGNQQKVLLGKWLSLAPSVLVLDDPTQGVDPNAREKIFAAVREAAAEGVGVLIFSTEPEQLADLCSRVIVLQRGRVGLELTGPELTRAKITEWCYA